MGIIGLIVEALEENVSAILFLVLMMTPLMLLIAELATKKKTEVKRQ